MADHFYQVDLGSAFGSGVTVTTSPTDQNVALRVRDAVAGVTKNKVALLLALEKIEAYIETHDAPA